jgi:UDP-N-acetylglucosamine:LPS N-acetylglucosamine transferase
MDQRMAEKQNAEFSEKRSKKKTRTSKEVTGSNTGALAGGALASAAGVGALVRSAQPQDVLIKYGYDGKAGGHLTQAEDLQRLLKEEGIRSHLQNAWGSNKRGIVSNIAKVYAKQIPAHAVIDTGWSGPALPNTGKVEWRSDYGSNPKESAIPTLSPDPSPHRPARRKTIAIYGGGSGYDVDNKLRDLAKNVDSSKYDRIHAYAGSSADRVRKELANLPPEIAKKIRVHGPMSRKAIQNAIASHHVNVGNAGLSTAHEIAASRTPGMIYQTKGGGGGPHMERNKNWVKRRGLPAPDPDDAAKTLTRILDNPEGARTQSDRRASRISNEALESRKQLVENVRRAIRVGRIKQAAIGSALLGTGVGVIANSRRKKPAPKQQFSEGESHPPLNKPMRGDVKKSKVYVRHPETGNIVKVNFGDKTMKIRKNEPDRRKSFRARHNCDNPGPKHKARYWSCRAW